MKIARSLLILLLLAAGLTTSASAEAPPETSAASFILMDAASGRTLAAQNEYDPRLIASTTKIMTALIALEQCDPDTEVEIEPAWTGIEGSSMYLTPGQVMTIRDLLYGLMLASGNDAAVALACITAGDVESFAELMNERAAELGCEKTHFENPNGLDSDEHYSCARDLAFIAREAIQNEEFRRIVSTSSATVDGRTFTNHNRLLRECDGVFGVKTGYTEAAGRTLVTCCERGGVTLICVTLSDPDDWNDHEALYDWAYNEYAWYDTGQNAKWQVPVIGGEAETVTVTASDTLSVPHTEDDTVETRVQLPSYVFPPIERGGIAGEIALYVNGEKSASVPLVFTESVGRTDAGDLTLWDSLRFLRSLSERKIFAFL